MTTTRIRRRRATVHVGRSRVAKTFAEEDGAAREAAFYQRFPWAAPRLLDHQGPVLTIEALPTAAHCPHWRPAAALRELLEALHAEGVHHRDVHVGNIVRGGGGPLLIDWETAIDWPAVLSYDLHGPEASGVPVPDIHAGITPQWWGSAQKMSIRQRWGI